MSSGLPVLHPVRFFGFPQKMQGRMYDHPVKNHEHARQDENDHTGTDQCAPRQQQADGPDDVDLRIYRHPECRCKKRDAGSQDRSDA